MNVTRSGVHTCVLKRKIRTDLDLLSIPQSGGKVSKRLGGIIIGCKYNAKPRNAAGFWPFLPRKIIQRRLRGRMSGANFEWTKPKDSASHPLHSLFFVSATLRKVSWNYSARNRWRVETPKKIAINASLFAQISCYNAYPCTSRGYL